MLVGEKAEAVDTVLIAPDAPNGSYLFRKLARDTPAVGARMPFGNAPLPSQHAQTVLRWILDGAPFN